MKNEWKQARIREETLELLKKRYPTDSIDTAINNVLKCVGDRIDDENRGLLKEIADDLNTAIKLTIDAFFHSKDGQVHLSEVQKKEVTLIIQEELWKVRSGY